MAIHTIATEASIGDDHQLVIQLPADVPAGTHHVTVVVETQSDAERASDDSQRSRFPVMDGMNWIEGEKLDRNEFYGD